MTRIAFVVAFGMMVAGCGKSRVAECEVDGCDATLVDVWDLRAGRLAWSAELSANGDAGISLLAGRGGQVLVGTRRGVIMVLGAPE